MKLKNGVLDLEIGFLKKFKTQKEKLEVLNTILITYFIWFVLITILNFGWITNTLSFIIVTLSIRSVLQRMGR